MTGLAQSLELIGMAYASVRHMRFDKGRVVFRTLDFRLYPAFHWPPGYGES